MGIKAIPKFQTLQGQFPQLEYEKLIYRFNTLLQKFTYKQEHKLFIAEGFQKINIDIRLLDREYCHLLTDEKIDSGLKLVENQENNDEDTENDEEPTKRQHTSDKINKLEQEKNKQEA